MAIGYTQFQPWITKNSNNSASTGRTNHSNNSTASDRLVNSSNTQIEQGSAGVMRELFSAEDTNRVANSPNSGETKIDRENTLGLPLVVEIDNVEVRTNNRSDEDVIKELAFKTCRSTMDIESELKRRYSNKTGASLNMNA